MQKFLAVFVCVLLAAGVMPHAAVQAQAESYKRYNDGIIAVDYLDTWQASPFGDFLNRGVVIAPASIPIDFAGGEPNILESTPLTQAIMGDTPIFVVWLTPLSEVEGTPREVMEEMFAQYNVLRTEKAGPLNLPNANGVEAIGTMDINGRLIGAHGAVLMGQGRFIFAIGLATETAFAENRAILANMMASLELVDTAHLPTPLPVNVPSDVEFSMLNGSGYAMLQPSVWQPEAIETFDGSLTLFCTPPAEPTQPYNSDLAAIDDFLATGTWSDLPSAELLGCVVDRTVAGVITVPIALLDTDSNPAQTVLQRVLTSGVVTKIEQTRLVNIQGHVGAEMLAVINGISPVETAPYGLYSVVLEHEGWLVIFAASSPLADFAANEPIFRTMAYSLTPQNLPDYNGYSAGGGMILSYGAELDRVLVADTPDEWRFYGSMGDMVAIAVTSTDFDAVLELTDAGGNYLADNDDYNDSNPYIMYTLPADGYYIIRVSAYSMGTGGNYHISLQVPEVIVN